MQKKCIKCGCEKSIKEFSKHKTNKWGYNNKCKSCVAEYGRQHREKNLEKEKQRAKDYYKTHKINKKIYNQSEKRKQYEKKYVEKNKNSISEKRKKYYRENIKKIRERNKKYYNKKIKTNPIFKLKKEVQLLIRDSLRRKKLSKNNRRTVEILGCTIEEFKIYLESKFKSWMNWKNKGLYNGEFNYGWDIDHIISIATAKSEEDIIKLNHYTNLQPLCSKINRDIKKVKSL